MTLEEIILKGGIAIWPLLLLSILSVTTIIERLWFWSQVLLQEKTIIDRVSEAAELNWNLVAKIAREYRKHPLGNFIYSPLKLNDPEPDVFHLALEAAADEELAKMRKGEKVLEVIVTLSPLLGLFGTVLGLIRALGSIRINDLAGSSASGVSSGIGESLISTAVGLLVAIITLSFYRLFQALWAKRVRIFRKMGSQLEVLYRQKWFEEEILEDRRENTADRFGFESKLSTHHDS